ncbi:MAG: hypothetical protein ABF820_14050, partial [Sporolactobacillus sp.]
PFHSPLPLFLGMATAGRRQSPHVRHRLTRKVLSGADVLAQKILIGCAPVKVVASPYIYIRQDYTSAA